MKRSPAVMRSEHLETRLSVLRDCYAIAKQDPSHAAERIGALLEQVTGHLKAGGAPVGIWHRLAK